MGASYVARKKRLLGDVYPGQVICWCKIDIGENAICVTRFDGQKTRVTRFIDDEAGVLVLKAKLRSYLRKRIGAGRWFVDKSGKTAMAHMLIYYPSLSWYTPNRPCRVLNLDLWGL